MNEREATKGFDLLRKNINIDIVKQIACDAGLAIMNIYGEDDFAVEYKSDESPLTAADKAAHEVIVAGLQHHFPDIPILSEEGGDIPYFERQTWERFWLVDPLDGTKEFIKRNGEFTVNIALIENQRPVLGVVYVPSQKKTYSGIVGKGAWVQIRGPRPEAQGSPKTANCKLQTDSYGQADEICVCITNPENGLTVVMSRSHPSPELEDFLRDINVAEALPVGSSLKLCVVAEGKADLYPRLGPTMEWDTAAGHAVVIAAGGTVETPEGEDLLYNKENLLNPYFIVRG